MWASCDLNLLVEVLGNFIRPHSSYNTARFVGFSTSLLRLLQQLKWTGIGHLLNIEIRPSADAGGLTAIELFGIVQIPDCRRFDPKTAT